MVATIKCIVVGDSEAVDSGEVSVLVFGKPFILDLRHNAGQDENARRLGYPWTDVFLVCYSVVSPSSYDSVKEKWVPEIKSHCADYCKDKPFLLVGTNIELRDDEAMIEKLAKKKQKPFTQEMGEQLAEEVGATNYFECSALTQKGLERVYEEAIIAAPLSALEEPRQPKKQKCIIL